MPLEARDYKLDWPSSLDSKVSVQITPSTTIQFIVCRVDGDHGNLQELDRSFPVPEDQLSGLLRQQRGLHGMESMHDAPKLFHLMVDGDLCD